MDRLTHTCYYLGFNWVRGIGPARLQRLIELCGSVAAAWHASQADLLAAGLDSKTCTALGNARQNLDLATELRRLEASGYQLVTLEDAAYPRLLAEIPGAPPLLYVRGTLTPADDWAVAVVGTRVPSSYGSEAARRIVGDLTRSGITIMSGLAKGIDTVAHETALDAGGRTIAVLGCGIDVAYPPRNRKLAARIVEQGALISDLPPGTRPQSTNFPARNRIISGLSRGTLVVEAGERSGALITVNFALEQGRDVFAVPGSIFSLTSVGTHRLLRNGAMLTTSAEDILTELNLDTAYVQQELTAALPGDTPTEAALLGQLSAEPQHIDQLTRASGLPPNEVAATLTMLELKGRVRQAGPQEYVLAR